MTVILFNSSVPGAPVPAPALIEILLGKAAHVVEFGILGWLAWRALAEPAGGVAMAPRPAAVVLVVGGVAVAALDELRQLFVAGRSTSPSDVLLDGVAVGMVTLFQLKMAHHGRGSTGGQARQRVAGEDSHEQVHR
jgi:VanZ family protein